MSLRLVRKNIIPRQPKKKNGNPQRFPRIIFYLLVDLWEKPFIKLFFPSITIIVSIFWLINAIRRRFWY